MRLIDADELRNEVMHWFIAITGNPKQTTVVNECKRSFIQMIDDQPTVGKWIPVEERLPERTIETFDGVFSSEPVAVTTVNENGKLYRSCDFLIGEQWACAFKNEKVIAWQPLPAPYQPKEGKSERY